MYWKIRHFALKSGKVLYTGRLLWYTGVIREKGDVSMQRKIKTRIWLSCAAGAAALGLTCTAFFWIFRVPFGTSSGPSSISSSVPVSAEITEPPSMPGTTVPETTVTQTTALETQTPAATSAQPTPAPTTKAPDPSSPGRYIQPAGASWNLLLVNAWNPMEKAYYQETHQNHIVSFKTGGQIDDRVSKALEEMLEAAKETGLRAGYLFRTPERSAANLENKTQYYINKGYSREAARKKALETIAAPYTSEHNLGLAIDMTQKGDGSLRTTFEQTAAFAWLQEHCAEYGFILRYPKGKQDITGVSYEPWHYRYVGREHAEEIMRRGLTLEEYLQEKGL